MWRRQEMLKDATACIRYVMPLTHSEENDIENQLQKIGDSASTFDASFAYRLYCSIRQRHQTRNWYHGVYKEYQWDNSSSWRSLPPPYFIIRTTCPRNAVWVIPFSVLVNSNFRCRLYVVYWHNVLLLLIIPTETTMARLLTQMKGAAEVTQLVS